MRISQKPACSVIRVAVEEIQGKAGPCLKSKGRVEDIENNNGSRLKAKMRLIELKTQEYEGRPWCGVARPFVACAKSDTCSNPTEGHKGLSKSTGLTGNSSQGARKGRAG